VSRVVQGEGQFASSFLLRAVKMGGGADQAAADRLVGGVSRAKGDLQISLSDILGRVVLARVEIIAPQRPNSLELKLEIGQFFAEYVPQYQLILDATRPSYEVYYAQTMDYCVPIQ